MTITTVLNCYRRPQNLKDQIKAIRDQEYASNIWIWVNRHPDNYDFDFKSLSVECVIDSSINFKYHGRFTAGLLSTDRYLAYFDDDTIPGPKWYSNCFNTINLLESKNILYPILGSAGVILHDKKYINHTRVGWPSQNIHTTEVDLVGHAWFFPQEVLKYLWYEDPISFANGEDIQLSYLAQKYRGARTFCPPHPSYNKDLWGSINAEALGTDDVAMSNGKVISHQKFFQERDEVIEEALQRGWKTIRRI